MAIILLLYSLYRLYVFWTRYRHLANVINKIPGPKEVPLVGNALQFLKHEEHGTWTTVAYKSIEKLRFFYG